VLKGREQVKNDKALVIKTKETMFKKIIKKSCALVGGFLSLISGVLWHLSAKAAVDALAAGNASAQTLGVLSAEHNLLAAQLAAAAGVFICVAIWLEE